MLFNELGCGGMVYRVLYIGVIDFLVNEVLCVHFPSVEMNFPCLDQKPVQTSDVCFLMVGIICQTCCL